MVLRLGPSLTIDENRLVWSWSARSDRPSSDSSDWIDIEWPIHQESTGTNTQLYLATKLGSVRGLCRGRLQYQAVHRLVVVLPAVVVRVIGALSRRYG